MKMKNNNEIDILYKKWLIFSNCMKELYEYNNIFTVSEKSITDAFVKRDIKVLKALNADINRHLKEMPLQHSFKVSKLLFENLGDNFNDPSKYYLERLKSLELKKSISSSKDFELIKCYLSGEIDLGNVHIDKEKLKLLFDKYVEKYY